MRPARKPASTAQASCTAGHGCCHELPTIRTCFGNETRRAQQSPGAPPVKGARGARVNSLQAPGHAYGCASLHRPGMISAHQLQHPWRCMLPPTRRCGSSHALRTSRSLGRRRVLKPGGRAEAKQERMSHSTAYCIHIIPGRANAQRQVAQPQGSTPMQRRGRSKEPHLCKPSCARPQTRQCASSGAGCTARSGSPAALATSGCTGSAVRVS